MRKPFLIPLLLAAVLLLSACKGTAVPKAAAVSPAPEPAETGSVPTEPSDPEPHVTDAVPSAASVSLPGETVPPPKPPDILVIVFSATGTTLGVAERIAALTGADLYRVVPLEPYTAEDLNWRDQNSRATLEQHDSSARPGISDPLPSLDGYKTVFIGYPIWWGEAPRIMETLVESLNFKGIDLIPFCTSGSSPIGESWLTLAKKGSGGMWYEGKRFPGSVSDEELAEWIEGFGLPRQR